jgi:hypothetical protein
MKHHRIVVLFVLLFSPSLLIGIPAFAGSANDGGRTSSELSSSWVKNCADWAEFDCNGKYLLFNNVWNKGGAKDYRQCIALKDAERNCVYKWTWNWPNIGDGAVRAYPEVIFGRTPWMSYSTTPSLPVKVADVGNIKASFRIEEYSDDYDGVWNISFDIWIVSGPIPTPETITREIMIWIKPNGHIPAPDKVKTVRIGGEVYDLYKADWDWTYLAFVKRTPMLKGEIPIGKLISYLANNGYLSAEEYVASIELGSELRYGHGYTILRDYSVDVPDTTGSVPK